LALRTGAAKKAAPPRKQQPVFGEKAREIKGI
jgi:hypothetical protein